MAPMSLTERRQLSRRVEQMRKEPQQHYGACSERAGAVVRWAFRRLPQTMTLKSTSQIMDGSRSTFTTRMRSRRTKRLSIDYVVP
jgi:hypothetical protein